MNSIKFNIIFALRRFPWIHRAIRGSYRAITNAAVTLCRNLLPNGPLTGLPRGFFSDYELLQKQVVQGRLLFPSQAIPPVPAGSLRQLCNVNSESFQPWPVFWTHHSEARLIGPTLVQMDSQGRLSLEGAFGSATATSQRIPRVMHQPEFDPAYRSFRRPPATRLRGNWTSLISRWGADAGYYHWFMDALPRLAMLSDLPEDIQVLVPPQLAHYQLDTLRWLGLERRARPTAETHLLLENYYFCSPTSMTNFDNPFAVQCMRRSFLSQADLSYDPPPRFYLRRVAKFRPILNEGDVLELFERKGWAIVDTEKLTQAQQIRLFAKAESICAPHGAGLTNLLWCNPGCKVLELCASTYLNGCFEGMAACLDLDYRYLVFEADNQYRSIAEVKAIERALQF